MNCTINQVKQATDFMIRVMDGCNDVFNDVVYYEYEEDYNEYSMSCDLTVSCGDITLKEFEGMEAALEEHLEAPAFQMNRIDDPDVYWIRVTKRWN